MDFYDLVGQDCKVSEQLAMKLGFKKIFVINKEVSAAGAGVKASEPFIAFGKDKNQLISLIKAGANAAAITDSYIDKKLMDVMKENSCILCIPMSMVTASYGMERSRNIYKIKKLFEYAEKQRIDVAFVSMAKSEHYLNSYMQLIELAKLVGASDHYARISISATNKRLIE